MKKLLLSLSLLCAFGANAQRTCGTPEKMNELIQADPSFAAYHQEVMSFIRNPENHLNRIAGVNSPSVVVTIPVVFHVLYKTAGQNIGDNQINSQLTILNNDFRKLNSDFNSVVPAPFQSFGADVEIMFCKATQTPAGVASTGITRKSVPTSFVFENQYYQAAGQPAWQPTKYLNIWVGRFSDGSLLGFAYQPSAAGAAFDGLCIGDQFFGNTGTAQFPYNKGRTATHEIGHYFGLDHIWGDAQCDEDDGVADTPATYQPYYDCQTYPDNDYTCAPTAQGAMYMNYMDYVPDACMAFFTQGQKTVMQAAVAGPRSSLLTSNGCSSLSIDEVAAVRAIAVYPNPVSQYFMITSPHTSVDKVEIFNANGQLVKTQALTDLNNKIYVDEFQSGTYFLRIYYQGTFLKSDKIVKK